MSEPLEEWEIIYNESIKRDPPSLPIKIVFYPKDFKKNLTPLKKQYIPDLSLSDFRKDYKKLISQFY
jgi:hypothetical protein